MNTSQKQKNTEGVKSVKLKKVGGPPTTDGTLSALIRDSPPHSDTVKPMDVGSTHIKWPTEYKSAGVIPFNQEGFWLGKMENGYADFGGKKGRDQVTGVVDDNPWTTAQRELREEGGLQATTYHSWTFHPENSSKHVTFYVESSDKVIRSEPEKIKEVRFVAWKEYSESGLPLDLHPRLKFDKGSLIRSTLRDVARKYTGAGKKRSNTETVEGKRVEKERKSQKKGEQEINFTSTVGVDTKHIVSDTSRPVVLEIREDVDMRMAYYLSSLTCEGYMNLNPKRKAKCDKEGRDVKAEFKQLQGYLRQILGKENFVRGYSYAKGKGIHKVGRLFSVGHGLQGVWSEVRGILARHMTDADMSNCHPRILSWVCDMNGIQNDELKNFIDNREVIYTDILTARWEMKHSGAAPQELSEQARGDAKATVLAMMNDEAPFPGIEKLPTRVQKLDAEFKRLQRDVCALPQYEELGKLSKTHRVKIRRDGTSYTKQNKLGSWLNLVLCDHEKTFTNDASKYLYEKHGLETGELAFDGFIFYGDHYHKEKELCGGMESMLLEKHQIHMPWTFKPHSTVIKVPDDFQVYDIPQRSYIQNISDDFLRDEEDFTRMISGLRGEYEATDQNRKGAFRAAAESLTIRSKRPQESFSSYWEKPILNMNAEVLKFYSRESNEKQHIFNVKMELGILFKHDFSEAELRDYFMKVFGDNLMAVVGDKRIFVWWKQRWNADDGSILGHILIQMVQKLFHSIIGCHNSRLEQATKREAWEKENEGRDTPKELEGGSREGCSHAVEQAAKSLSAYGNATNKNVRNLVIEQLRAYALQTDPFDQNYHLFCFTNAVFDSSKEDFVKASKYDYCLMSCGKPWIAPAPEEVKKVADIFESILPDREIRRGYNTVLKSGMTGTRPENFIVANGGGRNGKGVLNENATNCAGEYAAEGHLALLTKPIKDGPNPEAAGLHRKRLVIFSEPEDGLNEALRLSCIKKLTGCAELNARQCHSNNTKTELCATIIMECNKQPRVTGEKGEAATARLRLFPFDVTFTDDTDKLASDPAKFRPIDESLKTPEFKETHRCAFFMYLMRNGGDKAWFPEKTKALGAKYLEENDDLALWFQDNYVLQVTQPVTYFISINDVWTTYQLSNAYQMMTKAEKRQVTQSSFTEQVQKNIMLKKYVVGAMKVQVLKGDTLKQNTRVGIIHFKVKEREDSSMDDFGERISEPQHSFQFQQS